MAFIPTFAKKPTPERGEGGVRAKHSQGERLGFLDCYTLI